MHVEEAGGGQSDLVGKRSRCDSTDSVENLGIFARTHTAERERARANARTRTRVWNTWSRPRWACVKEDSKGKGERERERERGGGERERYARSREENAHARWKAEKGERNKDGTHFIGGGGGGARMRESGEGGKRVSRQKGRENRERPCMRFARKRRYLV